MYEPTNTNITLFNEIFLGSLPKQKTKYSLGLGCTMLLFYFICTI